MTSYLKVIRFHRLPWYKWYKRYKRSGKLDLLYHGTNGKNRVKIGTNGTNHFYRLYHGILTYDILVTFIPFIPFVPRFCTICTVCTNSEYQPLKVTIPLTSWNLIGQHYTRKKVFCLVASEILQKIRKLRHLQNERK